MRWTKKFPPMPTRKQHTIALCTGTTLVVAGGSGEGSQVLSTVEVMNTENLQWFTATDLPEPMYWASATTCGDQLYMLGRVNNILGNSVIKSVYTCSTSDLLQPCVSRSLSVYQSSLWRKVASLPFTHSTCQFFHGQLLAFGGSCLGKATTAVYKYNSATNSWKIISYMSIGRYHCFTAVLPDDQLMVVGGWTDGPMTDAIELASVDLS